MKYIMILVCLTVFGTTYAQPPAACGDRSVIAYYDPFGCNTSCPTVKVKVTGETPIATGITLDDRYSGIIPIGFNFQFYGINYTNCVIGANGTICFNTALANAFHPWSIGAQLLGNASAANSICGPWCDMDVTAGAGGTITYATSGVAPFRRFTATWCNVPMFNANTCPGQRTTTQIIIYETCNLIDVHIGGKQICAAWNNGRAIVGVQNNPRTNAVVPPARNWTPPFAVTNEAWRFTPGGGTYTVASIPYHPVPLASSTVKWFVGATQVGTGTTFSCAVSGTTYRAEVAGCNSVSSSTVTPQVTGVSYISNIDVCVGATASYTLNLPAGGWWVNGNSAIATINTGTATITGVSAGTTSYTYYTSQMCSHTLSITVKQCCNDTCSWITSGNTIYNGKNIFGTVSNDDIRIFSNNTQRGVVLANGFWGIKQLSPTTTLNVNCVPTTAPSGLRFENLPSGSGNALVVDANGYIYKAQSTVYKPGSEGDDMQAQLDALKQRIDDLTLQLSLLDCIPCDNGSASILVTPNPNNGHMTITYKVSGGFESGSLKIVDANGKLIKTTALQTSSGTVTEDLSGTAVSGHIIVLLIADGKAVARQKVTLVK